MSNSVIKEKVCKDCDVILTDDNQYPSSRKHGKRRCNVCERRNQNEFRAKNPRKDARKRTLAIYGLTEEDYDVLHTNQRGKCALCGAEELGDSKKKHLAVDHDHKTGKVRALLCHKCNRGLGHFNDDLELLNKAVAYIAKYS